MSVSGLKIRGKDIWRRAAAVLGEEEEKEREGVHGSSLIVDAKIVGPAARDEDQEEKAAECVVIIIILIWGQPGAHQRKTSQYDALLK